MKASARNQFSGTVKSIQSGVVNDTIEITVEGKHSIIATVTRESTEGLDLQVGSDVFALIKASAIILVSDADDVRFSARNQFAGKVAQVQKGAVNSEVVVDSGAIKLAVVITNESAERMQLQDGSSVVALFKASSVIVGRPR